MLKKLCAIMLVIGVVVSSVGCKSDDIIDTLQADGREYGQTYNFTEDEIAKTAFFSFYINTVTQSKELEDFSCSDGYQYAIVNVTIENTFTDSNPMFYDDFIVRWGEGEEDWNYAEAKFVEDQLEDEYTMATKTETTGNLIFVVPDDKKDLQLEYLEIYEDDFEGNYYIIDFSI